DVKPSNCFVASEGSVKVGDFGLSIPSKAQDLTRLTAAGVIMGTPAYCSPEQLKGEDLDVRSDIYSVGTTLFFLLTGRVPFDDPNPIRLIARTLQDEPPALPMIRPDTPDGLARIVTQCMAKRREQRPQGYGELTSLLLPYAQSAVIFPPLHLRLLAGFIDVAL